MSRLFTERRFEVFDASDRRIGAASTLWLILDLERRRPVRLPAHVVERLGELGLGSEPRRFGDLVTPDPVDRELAFTVRRSDLDSAEHVNNTSYVEWAIEAVPDEVWSTAELAELEIQFVSECHHGQTVVSRSQLVERGGDLEVRHQLMRSDDGAEVARALRCGGRKGARGKGDVIREHVSLLPAPAPCSVLLPCSPAPCSPAPLLPCSPCSLLPCSAPCITPPSSGCARRQPE